MYYFSAITTLVTSAVLLLPLISGGKTSWSEVGILLFILVPMCMVLNIFCVQKIRSVLRNNNPKAFPKGPILFLIFGVAAIFAITALASQMELLELEGNTDLVERGASLGTEGFDEKLRIHRQEVAFYSCARVLFVLATLMTIGGGTLLVRRSKSAQLAHS